METLIYINNLEGMSGWTTTIDIKLSWYWYKAVKNSFIINSIY